MGTLVPTPVTLEDLIDETSDINAFNDGIKTQLVSPRTLGPQRVTVQVADDPFAVLADSAATGTTANKLVDSGATFVTNGVSVGDAVYNDTDNTIALVTAVDSETQLSLSADIMVNLEEYRVTAASFWTQRHATGEWRRSGCRLGNDVSIAYTLPVNTASTVVHEVVYPIALAAIGTYPPITSAETP